MISHLLLLSTLQLLQETLCAIILTLLICTVLLRLLQRSLQRRHLARCDGRLKRSNRRL